MFDYIQTAIDLARAFFKSFAEAVTSYPIPTAAVFAASYFLVWPEVRKRYDDHLIIAAAIQFVLTVFAAHVVGYLFAATLWVLSGLFGSVQGSTRIFVDHPIEFVVHLIAWCVIALLVALYLTNWQIQKMRRLAVALAIVPVLWATFITANIHTHLTKPGDGGSSSATLKSGG